MRSHKKIIGIGAVTLAGLVGALFAGLHLLHPATPAPVEYELLQQAENVGRPPDRAPMTREQAPPLGVDTPADVLVGDPANELRGIYARAGEPVIWKNDTPETVRITSSADGRSREVLSGNTLSLSFPGPGEYTVRIDGSGTVIHLVSVAPVRGLPGSPASVKTEIQE